MYNKESCLKKLESTSNNFLNDTCSDKDKNILDLLKEIIVVEKETISGENIYNQLKESYFENDDSTSNFVNNLYNYDLNTISDYLDIYVEQAYENEMDENYINEKIYNITNILRNINPELVILLEEKLTNLSNN